MPEDEKKEAADPSALAAVLGVAAAVAQTVPASDPLKDMRAIQDNLESQLEARTKDALKLSFRNQELAADRDRWRERAQKAEPLVDGLALERLTKERDGLRGEVSAIQKLLNETKMGLGQSLSIVRGQLKASDLDLQEQVRKHSALQWTMESMQRARDAAQSALNQEIAERVAAVKRVGELEAQIKDLIAPRPASPTDKPASFVKGN